jgi:purine nucleosidase
VPFYIEFYERFGEADGASMHDPLALAIAIDASLATLRTTRVEVETDGTWTRGATVTDLRGIRRSPWPTGWMPEDNARVALDVDDAAFMDRFIGRLRSLVEAGA